MNAQSLNDVVRKVLDGLPDGVKQLPEDMRRHIQAAVVATLQKLDVVTREEFDAQRKVLERTREKLDRLEQQLNDRG